MERERGAVSWPPLLDGTNYEYWKACMEAFLKSIDSRTWKAIVNGWEHPTVTDKDGNVSLKPEGEWTKGEDELALGNYKALNEIFNGVDTNMFRLIKRCTVAKQAWEILITTQEGTSKVKNSRLQMLTTKFENLRMKEDESVHDFHMTILDYANTFDSLGEKVSEERLVRMMLRSLPKKFDMKVTAIEEFTDLYVIKLDEHVGSLHTYEISANERVGSKSKSIAFVSNTESDATQDDTETDESLCEAMALLGRQFNKVLRRMNRRGKQNVKQSVSPISLDIHKNSSFQKKPKTEEKVSQVRGVHCHECNGYGNIRYECPNYLKKQQKGITATWSEDEDSDEDTLGETTKHITALTGVCLSDTVSNHEDVTYEELAESYRALCKRSEEVCRSQENQKRLILELQSEKNKHLGKISELNNEVTQLNSTLEKLKTEVSMNESTAVLEKLIESQVPGKSIKGIDYEYQDLNKPKEYDSELKFLPFGGNKRPPMPNRRLPHVQPHLGCRNMKPQPWICHYFGRRGHIRPFCYRLYRYPRRNQREISEKEGIKHTKEWKPKGNDVGLIAHTSLRATSREDWYFDSGCSRHMTEIEKFLVDLKSFSTSYVTFGDGTKGEIKGIGRLANVGQPDLNDVLLVKGLTANLISISQLCDQGMKVNFTKGECLVTNEEGELIMKGVRFLMPARHTEVFHASRRIDQVKMDKFWYLRAAQGMSRAAQGCTSSSEFLFDPEIEKTARGNRKAIRQAKEAARLLASVGQDYQEIQSNTDQEPIEMAGEENYIPIPPPRRTLGDYGQRNNRGIANLGFQPVNPVTFDIKNTVINALKEDQYSGAESQCPNLHLSHFYDACDYTDPPGISESDKRLRLFKFSLTGRAKDWLDTIPPGTIATWQDLERKFKDRYFPIHKFLERRSEIMNFEQGDSEDLYDAWERFKLCLKKCPDHGIDELQQMQYFNQGLRPQTRLLLDTSAGGSLKNKDEVEAKELVETMAQNEYRAQNDRGAKKKAGILELDTNNAILAQMKLMSKEMEELKKASSRGSQAHVNQFEEVKCDFCRGSHENGKCFPEGSEQAKYLANFRKGYPNNQGYGWGNQGQNSNSNPPARKPSPMEESINKFIQVTQESIARVERPGVRLGHCNLIFALCKTLGVPELDKDAEILPVAPLTLSYFRTFRSSPVPAAEIEQFVEEEDPDEDREGDEVENYLNDNVNENENEGRDQEEDALMAEIDGFEGVSQQQAPQGGFHYSHHEDELARMLHELDLYKSTGPTIYTTISKWEAFLHDDRVRYEGIMGRRSREWERNYMFHHPPASPHGGPSYAPHAAFGASQEYDVGVENPNLSFDVTDFGLRYDHEGNVRNLASPGASNPPSRTPQ
ncbi:hypothetical protein TSUD_284440 [Trifolium subterraneum]|uniref:Uncharacterized protein n=1 Tax=Trifolium subterraneum TaxID=3900 RepID=A0A2Z6N8I9_TRISU|nr:hypothetical protein TSUD_284440 [Trifolium subterraneum]